MCLISALLLVLGAGAPAVGGRAQGDGPLLSLLDYFSDGRERAEEYLARERDTATLLGRPRRATVHLMARGSSNGGATHCIAGSGIVVDRGRRILTAGHTFRAGGVEEIVVTLSTGETREARIAGREFLRFKGAGHDWAVLEIVGPPAPGWIEIRRDSPGAGEPVFILGYPDQVGVDRNGKVAYMPHDGAGERYEPLVTVAGVLGMEPLRLEPRAGFVPTGGMSGGPVVDRRGRLVGIFVSVSRIDTASGAEFRYNAAPVRNATP